MAPTNMQQRAQQKLRIGIVAFLHESNTFISSLTTLEHFRQDLLVVGDEVGRQLRNSRHEVGGFFAGLDEMDLVAVPIFAARAYPYGTIEKESFRVLISKLRDAMHSAGPLDGLLVAAHGAAVSQDEADVDGDWLSLLRGIVGHEVPIIGTLDLHANLSRTMLDACDALIAYRTNPHLDQQERGRQAARLMARSLHGEVRPVMRSALLPMAINIERQDTDHAACRGLLELAIAVSERPAVLSTSITLGFPYADVKEMGCGVIVVTDDDHGLATDGAQELAQAIWDSRNDLVGKLVDVTQTLDETTTLSGSVCLLDMGDNVGGGAYGDGTHLAAEIHRRGMPDAFVCLCDPESVVQAERAGIGRRVPLRVGAKSDAKQGQPIEDQFTVVSLHDGRFEETQVRHGGISRFDQGPTAVVCTDGGLTVMLTTRRMVPFSLGQLTSCNMDPTRFRTIVVKGVHAPIAAYRDVCSHFIRVNTPGDTCADLTQLPYLHRRRPLFPFEKDFEWSPESGPRSYV